MSFEIALSGLNAASNFLSVTSNNIANANSSGFKSSRAEFGDVFAAGSQGVGSGVQLSTVRQNFNQGSVEFTQRSLDLAISGEGFFMLSDKGDSVFTRAGQFGVDADGYVSNALGQRVQAYPPLSGGGFNTGGLIDLRLSSSINPPVASSEVSMGVNLPANATPPIVSPFDPANANTFNNSTSTTVYDSLGASHTATYYFVKGAADGDWEVAMTIDGNLAGPPSPVTFDSQGQITTPATGTVTMPAVTPGNGADPIALNLNFENTTQFGDTFAVNALNPDGSSAGRLKGIEIDQSGVVFVRFTNGNSDALGKLAIANFPSPEGLEQLGNNTWRASFGSGEAVRGEANTSSYGLIQAGALEASNVDLTEELVSMITAQRAFQANAQVISTMDQVTQSIINIR
ncbi:MAG: flagellar hook protein FlgE [Gammaproteobacteria bacterium]|nr:flagellar hook protein FlgE [Gammaproteobacteria bacterium]